VLAFAVPFVFADVLRLPRGLYYGIYATAATATSAPQAGQAGRGRPRLERADPRHPHPIIAVITNSGLHVTAVLHSYDTETYRPPHRSA
jgi:hypothetical protein